MFRDGMTPEESLSFLSSVMEKLDHLNDLSDKVYLKNCLSQLEHMNSVEVELEKRPLDEVVRRTKMPEIMLKLFKSVEHLNPLEDGSEDKMIWKIYKYLIGVIWNFCDSSPYFASHLASLGMADVWMDVICNKEYRNRLTEKRIHYIYEASLQTVHNVVRTYGNAHLFSRPSFKSTLTKLIPMREYEDICVPALLSLAYLVTEDEYHLLLQGCHMINDLLRSIQEAMNNTQSRRSNKHFSMDELLSALAALTVNNSISKAVIESGGIPVLKKLCNATHPEELQYATKIFCNILFDEDCRGMMRSWGTMVTLLTDLQQLLATHDGPIFITTKKHIQDSLCLLEREMKHSTTEANRDRFIKPSSTSDGKLTCTSPQVFISYCWCNKAEVLKVYNKLKSLNIDCWLDAEQIGGSMLEPMAKGIENASVVLMCYSEAYHKSPNCRMEAEYAVTMKKPILPLCMQHKYKPVGWLGIILGAKLYYDFSGVKDFDETFSCFQEALFEFIPRPSSIDENFTAQQTHQTEKVSIERSSPPQVFISYCRSNKANVLKVYNELKSWCIDCWLDTMRLRGSKSDAKSKGIDNSSVVLVCYSEAYFESVTCQMEAKYASEQEKPMLFLCMQHKYKPRGWLGLIKSDHQYYDFSEERKFYKVFSYFIKDLLDLIGTVQPKKQPVTESPMGPRESSFHTRNLDVSEWTEEDVSKWLQKNNLAHVAEKLFGMNGHTWLRLILTKKQAPEFFFSSLVDKFKLEVADGKRLVLAVDREMVLNTN